MHRARHLLAAWRQLPSDERAAFLAMSCLIPCMAVAVRLFDFRSVFVWLARRATTGAEPVDPAAVTRRAMRALSRARRHAPFRGNCLSQSLALWWRLRRQGVQVDLLLGASLESGRLEAHAWVERDGRVLNDSPDVRARFAPLGPLSSSSWVR